MTIHRDPKKKTREGMMGWWMHWPKPVPHGLYHVYKNLFLLVYSSYRHVLSATQHNHHRRGKRKTEKKLPRAATPSYVRLRLQQFAPRISASVGTAKTRQRQRKSKDIYFARGPQKKSSGRLCNTLCRRASFCNFAPFSCSPEWDKKHKNNPNLNQTKPKQT